MRDAVLVFGDREDDDVVVGGVDHLGVERHAQRGIEHHAQQRAAAAESAAIGEHGVVGEHRVDAGQGGVGLPAQRLHGARARLRW